MFNPFEQPPKIETPPEEEEKKEQPEKEEENKEIKEKALEKESPKIELPRNFETIERLQNKLKDYKQRLESKKAKVDPYKAPEQTFRVFAGTKYKIAVVEKLLLEGDVDTHQLSLELGEKDGQFDKQAFENACSVIKDYVATGGKGVTGGTGF